MNIRTSPTSTQVHIVPFHLRPVGSPHAGLRPNKTANTKFDKLMSYRSYGLMITTDARSSRDTTEVFVHLKNVNVKLRNHVFNGNYRTNIIAFLPRFVNEADMLIMFEAQAFIALSTFLVDPAKTQFRTNSRPPCVKYSRIFET